MSKTAGSRRGHGSPFAVVAAELKRRLTEGPYQTGTQLPPRTVLVRELGASPITVQKAVNLMKHEGFLTVHSTKGTFVAEAPPHLCHIGVVFYHVPSPDVQWTRFWGALSDSLSGFDRPGRRLIPYYGVDGSQGREPLERLVNDLDARRLAGVIFTVPLDRLATPRIMHARRVPTVVISHGPWWGFPRVAPDWHQFMNRALDELAKRRCRRIAMITLSTLDGEQVAQFNKGCAERRLETRPYWIQPATHARPDSCRQVAHLLMTAEPKNRPDGLILADDNLIEETCQGLLAAKVDVSATCTVVAHANFPRQVKTAIPLVHIGFDVRAIMSACLTVVERQIRGEPVPGMTMIPAVCENELPQE